MAEVAPHTEDEKTVECLRCGKRHRDDPPRLVQIAELSFENSDPETGTAPLRVMFSAIGVMVAALTDAEVREGVAIHDDVELVEQLRELAVWYQATSMAEAVRERQEETPEQRAEHLRSWGVHPATVNLDDAEAVQEAINAAAERNHVTRVESSQKDD